MPDVWPARTPRDDMLARVIVRGRRIRMINRVVAGLLAGSAVAVGLWLGYTGVLSFSGTAGAAVTGGGLPYYLCPADGEAGAVHHGDRVLITGVDGSGDWLQIRDPGALTGRVWVQREYVDPDGELDVPVAECSTEDGDLQRVAGPEATTTTSTTVPEEPEETTTTSSTTTTTTAPSPTTTHPSTTTTAPPTTTTTAPRPSIGSITRTPDTIIEDWGGVCGGPTTSTISAPIANATSATMSWDVGPQPRTKPMTAQGGVFTAVLGPFDETVVDSGHVIITVTISANGPGGQSTKQSNVRLDDCFFG